LAYRVTPGFKGSFRAEKLLEMTPFRQPRVHDLENPVMGAFLLSVGRTAKSAIFRHISTAPTEKKALVVKFARGDFSKF
jgi:hypothetical protein